MSEVNRRWLGMEGEDRARAYLEEKGLRWRESNFYTDFGELDLVMQDGFTIVFVEVKRKLSSGTVPEEALTPAKRRHVVKAALAYLAYRKLTDRPLRFDVVAITPGKITHYENAFEADDGYYY